MNFKNFLASIEADKEKLVNALKTLEGKVTTGSTALLADVTAIADKVQSAAVKIEGVIPAITDDLSNPIVIAIANNLPDGNTIRLDVLAVVNKFAPIIQKAADPVFINLLKRDMAAEILMVENAAVKTIGDAINDVEAFFTELPTAA